MFRNFSIKWLLLSVGIIIILAVGINIAVTYMHTHKVKKLVHQKETEIVPHLLNFLKLQKDVIQVQQWLTDVSATRAKEGFDDGFSEAKIYYDEGNKVLDILIQAHQEYQEDEMVRDLKKFKSDFQSFYEIGIKMANTSPILN